MLNNIKTKILFVFPLFLALYFIFNLLGGERGLFSYFDKKNIFINTYPQTVRGVSSQNGVIDNKYFYVHPLGRK